MAGRESIAARTERAKRILRKLRKAYGDADCALTHKNAFELLIATILSAQSTDETVNKVTPALFEAYPDADSLAVADQEDVQEIVHPTGFFRQKAKNIIGAARRIVDEFEGEVPESIESLVSLPGVARKTANVVLGTWFGKNEGVVVDTHVGRLADRLRLTWNHKDSKDAIRIEKDLMRVIPQKDWTYISHALIWHGRKVCSARKPTCEECELVDDCPSAGKL
ncbi:MAG: endonuclease III [Phycisphaerae bacterium]|nr:MAG: endonuclease III [Phycisphaerae bacterium]